MILLRLNYQAAFTHIEIGYSRYPNNKYAQSGDGRGFTCK